MRRTLGLRPTRNIPARIKQKLVEEAGGKCANPGCSNIRVDQHHIREWAVYKAHDSDHMIAICPACHDAVHHGQLRINDSTLYQWKGIERLQTGTRRAHLYVEPSRDLTLLAGTIHLRTRNQEQVVFEISSTNRVQFRIVDSELLFVSCVVEDNNGTEVVRISDNYILARSCSDVTLQSRPGEFVVKVPCNSQYIRDELVDRMRQHDPRFGMDGEVVMLGAEVVCPGAIRIRGIWNRRDSAIIITDRLFSFASIGMRQPISLMGGGCLDFVGPITLPMFGFQ